MPCTATDCWRRLESVWFLAVASDKRKAPFTSGKKYAAFQMFKCLYYKARSGHIYNMLICLQDDNFAHSGTAEESVGKFQGFSCQVHE